MANPNTILLQAANINQLKSYLAWDLATAQANHAGHGLNVQMQLQTHGVMPVNLFMNSRDLEELITNRIEVLLNSLEESGVELEEIIKQYKAVGSKMISNQENKNPLDRSPDL